VIRKVTRFVLWSMQFAVQSHSSPIAGMVRYWRRPVPLERRTRRNAPKMPSENEATLDSVRWGGLISAIAQHQDRAAFASLFEHFAPRIKAFMQRSGASEATAEELAQETMLSVWRKAALFDPQSAGAAGWIFTIARNLRIDYHRRERRGGMIEASDVEIEFQIDESPLPDSRLASAQNEDRIRSALSKLSEDQMRVVEMSFFDEKAHAEIAQILGIPLGTVKSRLRLAMTRLRNLLSELS
jgi:RNA polymerase sigma-70 factor, ECF subfamily